MDIEKKIVIGIPTFRRPQGLKRLLDSIGKQNSLLAPDILVADNDVENSQGLEVVKHMCAEGFPFTLIGIMVPERGISQVRNALMRKAFDDLGADMLIMVDDDELVDSGWLAALVAMQEEGGFDVVGGAVLPEFESHPKKWMKALPIYYQVEKNKPGSISIIQGTGNVLLSRNIYERFPGNNFDHSFALTGGGDKEFFTRLKRKGATFGFAPDAICYEFINRSRMTRRWAIQRAFRIGSGDARILKLHLKSGSAWVKEIVKMGTALAILPLLVIVFACSPARQMRVLLLFVRQLGKLNGLFGKPPKVYEFTHGA